MAGKGSKDTLQITPPGGAGEMVRVVELMMASIVDMSGAETP